LLDASTYDVRSGCYVVSNGGKLYVVKANTAGEYDTDDGNRLSDDDRWHTVASALLDMGGDFVEVPWNDVDGSVFATALTQSGFCASGKEAHYRPELAGHS
jgi:hypothetical protein